MASEVKIIISADGKSVIPATTEVAKAFETLKAKTVGEINQQKDAANRAYNTIKNSGTASASEIQQAWAAKNRAMSDLDKDYFGKSTSLVDKIKSNWLGIATVIGVVAGAYSKIIHPTMNYLAGLETAQLGIGTAFMTSGKYIDATTGKALAAQDALKAAQQDSKNIIAELQVANLQTIATLDQLVRAYQETLPVAMQKGFDKTMVKDFTVAVVQAAGAIGLSMDMLAEETRSLLMGTINPRTSRIGVVLGLTNKDIRENSGNAQQLFNFLMGKLAAYRVAGIETQQTWKGLWSNVWDIAMQASGMALEPLFEIVKREILDLTNSIITIDEKTKQIKWNPEFLAQIKEIKSDINEWVITIYDFATGVDRVGGLMVRMLGTITAWTSKITWGDWKKQLEEWNKGLEDFHTKLEANYKRSVMKIADLSVNHAVSGPALSNYNQNKQKSPVDKDAVKHVEQLTEAVARYEEQLVSLNPLLTESEKKFMDWENSADALMRKIDQQKKVPEAIKEQLKDRVLQIWGKGFDFLSDEEARKQLEGLEQFYSKVDEYGQKAHDYKFKLIDAEAKRMYDMYHDEVAAAKWARDEKLKFESEIQQTKMKNIAEGMASYASAFEQLSQLYKEDSAGRKTLHDISMAFSIAEKAALAAQAVEAAVVAIATQGAGDPYSAFPRIAAMAAAMAALLGSIGIAFAGGGESSEPSTPKLPASTVLGAEAGTGSESASKSLKLLDETYKMEYTQLRELNDSMHNLNSNITGLVNSIVRAGSVKIGSFDLPQNAQGFMESSWGKYAKYIEAGFSYMISGPVGLIMSALGTLIKPLAALGNWINNLVGDIIGSIFGGEVSVKVKQVGIKLGEITVKELLDGAQIFGQQYALIKKTTSGGWFGSDDVDYSTLYQALDEDLNAMFTNVFKDMSRTLVALSKSFGTDVEKTLAYMFPEVKLNLKGMNAEEINKAVSEFISKAGDEAVDALFGDIIKGYQQVGEGLLETAVRLAQDKAIIEDLIGMTNQSFEGTTEEVIAFSEALIEMAGGLDALTEAANAYYSKFFSEAEQNTRTQQQMVDILASLNMTLPETRQGYRDLVEGLDLTTQSGQEAYVTLMQLAASADSYYSYIEQAAKEAYDKWVADNEAAIQAFYNIQKEALQTQIDNLNSQIDALDKQKSAIADQIDSINEALKLTQKWKDVLTSVSKQILDMTTGPSNQQDIFERMDIMKSEILRTQGLYDNSTGETRADYGTQLQTLISSYLGMAQEAYQRPSPEYQAIYNEILGWLENIKTDAAAGAANETDLLGQIATLQAQSIAIDAQIAGYQQEIKDLNAQMAALDAQMAADLAAFKASSEQFYKDMMSTGSGDTGSGVTETPETPSALPKILDASGNAYSNPMADFISGIIDKYVANKANSTGGDLVRPPIGKVIPAFGDGGTVYTPTLAWVGEKEPEEITPLSKKKSQQVNHIHLYLPPITIQAGDNARPQTAARATEDTIIRSLKGGRIRQAVKDLMAGR